MNETNVENNQSSDSKKIITLVVLILTVMVCTTSATYAYFALAPATNSAVTGTAASASLSLSVTKNFPTKANTGVLVPQKEAALASAMGSTYGCVDGNTNIVCQVYTITVTNNSSAQVVVNGTIAFANSTKMPNLKWRKTTNTTTLGSNATNAANTTSEQSLASNVTLKKGGSGASGNTATYYIVVWINAQLDSSGKEVAQTDTGTYTATVKFTSSNGTGITSTITS